MAEVMTIDTAPSGPPGFLGLISDGEGGFDGVEWLQGPRLNDGRWLCLNSNNYTRFPATHWAPLPWQIQQQEPKDG